MVDIARSVTSGWSRWARSNGPARVYRQARTLLREGRLGPIVFVQCNFFRNLMPGFGNPPDQDPPAGMDWDMMLGPAPSHRYNPNRAIYHFRWFWDYSGGQMTNLGHHSLDVVHWCLDLKGPKAVSSAGGRYFLKDNCEVPDVQDVILEYPGFTTVCQYRECTTGHGGAEMGALNFLGTKGTLPLTRQGYEVFPDPKKDPIDQVARILGGHPVGGPQAKTDDGPPQFWTEKAKDLSGDAMLLIPCTRQLPGVHPFRKATGLGPGKRPSGGDGMPPGQPLSPHRPQDPMGRGEGGDPRRRRGGTDAGATLSRPVGRGAEEPDFVNVPGTRNCSLFQP